MKNLIRTTLIVTLILVLSFPLLGIQKEKVSFQMSNIIPTNVNANLEPLPLTISGDTLLNESFEGTVTGWSYIDNDGDGTHWGIYEEYDAPADTFAHTGFRGAAVLYNSAGNDDWFLTPKIGISAGTTVEFSFWAHSYSASYLEDFNVKISTTGNSISDFSTRIDSVVNVPVGWTKYTYDLSSYVGDSVTIAVQCVSVDDFYLCTDDYLLTATGGEEDEWSQQYLTKYNTEEADLTARTGDIDNLGFGWLDAFDPFSGESTSSHSFPWDVNPEDAEGTDRIMVVSSYTGNNTPAGSDGYSTSTSRPENDPRPITVSYDLQDIPINSAALQIFVDDFQAPVWQANYQVTIDDVRVPFLEDVINSLSQTGPVGKMISVNVPSEYLQYFSDGEFSILFDDPTTGAGDGYAIDFVKLLINPGSFTYTGTITGTVINSEDDSPIEGATVTAGGIIEDVTNSSGEFTLSSVPAGLNYIEVSADGYQLYNTNVDLQSGETENISVELTPESPAEAVSISGQVTDATDGTPIEGATVTVADLTDITDSNGNYEITNVPMGELSAAFSANPTSGTAPLTVNFTDNSTSSSQTVSAAADGYIDYVNENFIISETGELSLNISLSPELTEGNMRLVLNWDDDPRDLDSHLETPEIDGSSYHVYYNSKGDADNAPYAILDHDDTDGYGPETVTIHQFFNGTYHYYVYKYAGDQDITQSGGVVQIYNQNGILETIQAPTTGSGEYWHICDIDGETQNISIVNEIFATLSFSQFELANNQKEVKELALSKMVSVSSEINSWNWDFGDGSTSTEQNPSYTYQNAGAYTISLTVSDGTTENTKTRDSYITVTEAVGNSSLWTALHPTPTTNTIDDVQFANSTIGYACGNKGTMLKTTDGGDNWNLLKTDVDKDLKKLHFIDVNTGYVVGDDGTVLKTVDGGNSFMQLSTEDTIGTRDLFSVYFTDANTGFVGGDVYHAVIWNTTDGGNTWHETALPLDDYTDVNDIEFLNSSTGIAICDDGKIVRTTDSGTSWTEVTSGTTENLWEMYFLDSNNGWAVGSNRNVAKTTDGGANWSLISSPSSYNDYLDVYFTDVNTGYAVIDNGVYKTIDGGANWDSKLYQYDYYLNTLDKRDGYAYAFTAGGHLFKTNDSWETNTVINSQACEIINAVKFKDIYNGIAVDGGGNIMRTTDAGENWELIDSDCSSLKDVKYLNSTDIIAVGSSGTVLKSTNNGSSWTEISTANIQSKTLYGFDAPTSNVFYAVGYDGLIVKSSDGGSSWTEQAFGDTNLYDVKFLDANTGFAVGGKYNKSKLLKTTNGGTNWNDVSCPVDEQLNKIIFVNSTTGFIAGNDGTILKTINGGDNWSDISAAMYKDFNDISFVNENFGYIVGTYGEIFFTEDGGTTWNRDETFPASNYLYGVDFIDDSTGYVVGMYSSILRYRKGIIPPNVAVQEQPGIADEYILIQNYPNPFNPVTTISYEIPEAAKVTINIYNIAGQKVETLLSEFKQSGKYKIVWNANNFASGVYFYKIQTKDFVKTNKMLLLK